LGDWVRSNDGQITPITQSPITQSPIDAGCYLARFFDRPRLEARRFGAVLARAARRVEAPAIFLDLPAVFFFPRDFFAGRRIAGIAWPAARTAFLAMRVVLLPTDRATDAVLSTALAATRFAAAGDVMPVVSAARSANAAAPCTPAATPRPTKLAPASIMLLTASAACAIVESSP
jgi:hypothetical protein